MRGSRLLVAVAIVASACSAAPSETTPTSVVDAPTTTAPATSPTTTEEPSTTSTGAIPGAQFVISSVTFGSERMVVITNIGESSGSLAGHFLCQRPAYWAFPDVEVAPGQSLAVSAGGNTFDAPPGALTLDEQASLGGLFASDGELGLYDSNSFGSSSSILSYVEWGSSGHGRSSVAVSAGIWPSGAFVETTPDSSSIAATTLPATEPTFWESS